VAQVCKRPTEAGAPCLAFETWGTAADTILTHVERLFQHLAPGKGHGRAVVAVARHLAEASYWVLRKRQPSLVARHCYFKAVHMFGGAYVYGYASMMAEC